MRVGDGGEGTGRKRDFLSVEKGSDEVKKLAASVPTRVVKFNLPKGYAVSDLRAMGSAPKFPENFLKGQKEFSHLSTGADTGTLVVASGNVAITSQTTPNVPDSGRLSVTESDFWKVVGDYGVEFLGFTDLAATAAAP